MKIRLVSIIITLNLYFNYTAFNQSKQLPFIRSAEVKCIITFNIQTKLYEYRYQVINNNSSLGNITDFSVNILKNPGTITFDTTNLRYATPFIESSFRDDFPSLSDRIVPVGFPSVPHFWTALITNKGLVSFGGDERNDIKPGKSLENYVMTSPGLPKISELILDSYYDINAFYPSVDAINNPDSLIEKVNQDREAIKFHGYTIGPTAPPKNFDSKAWCDTLISYITQCHFLGWINNTRDDDCDDDEKAEDGIVKNLGKQLEKARNFIEKTQYNKAQQQLVKFLNKVEKLWKRQQTEEAKNKKNPKIIFTSEAYALLKYNAEYLEDQLPEKIKK